MSETFPTFDGAVEHFRSFLADHEYPTVVQWVFRDQVYADRDTFYIAPGIPESNSAFAAQAFHAGTVKDQIAVHAVAYLPNSTVATIWFPLTDEQRPQGWEHGLRYSIVKPLQRAVRVTGGWQWRVRTFGSAYRRYHRFAGDFILSTDEVQSSLSIARNERIA